jgi:hypothetical protein
VVYIGHDLFISNSFFCQSSNTMYSIISFRMLCQSIRPSTRILNRLVADFPPRRSGFASGQHVGFVVDKAAMGQVFSEYFGSPANHSSNFIIIVITRGWENRPLVAAVQSGPNWTPPQLYQFKKKSTRIYVVISSTLVLWRGLLILRQSPLLMDNSLSSV